MREAFELAWNCALLHGDFQAIPEILHIDDINFWAPVEVGSILRFTARVTYVDNPIIHVNVLCEQILKQM